MRTRYYYNFDTNVAYKIAGDGTSRANLDVLMWRSHSAKRTTCRILGRLLKHDMTRAHMWEPMDILGTGVILHLAH